MIVDRPIFKVAQISHDLKLDGKTGITDLLVRTVFKKQMGLSYRPIKGVANTANTHKNMILRQ